MSAPGWTPLPWRVDTRISKRATRVIVVDADGNDLCEAYGETIVEAQHVANFIVAAANAKAKP